LKWVVAAGGVAFVGYAVRQYLTESARAARASRRKREPWEVV
jgi:membrane protein required for beta-lactamase induction